MSELYNLEYPLENSEMQQNAETGENREFLDTQEVLEGTEAAEGQELTEKQEKTDEGQETLGYSSDYYKSEMAKAIKNGNQIAYENAKKHYSSAKVKETVGAGETADGEAGEEREEGSEEKETLGYSSDYYKSEMAKAIRNGNQIAYENAKDHYSEKKVKEIMRKTR